MDALESEIEKAVRDRRTGLVRRNIRHFIRREKGALSAKIRAAEWYRRLGLYRDAYLLMAPKAWVLARAERDEEYARQLLWAAFYLHLQGATGYATSILSRVRFRHLDAYRIAGNVRLSGFDFAGALAAFDAYFKRSKAEDYASKMLRVSRIDALIGLRRFDEALAALSKIRVETTEKLLAAILFQVRGECLALAGRFDESLTDLERAKASFPDGESAIDRAFLEKWRGYSLARLGRREEAKLAFETSLAILEKPEYRPEMALDCRYQMACTGFLPSAEFEVIAGYPDLPEFFLDRPSLPKCGWIGDRNSRLSLQPGRDEWRQDGVRRIGLPKEIRLLAFLRRADRVGISVERLKPLLWPEDVASFLQLEGRLTMLFRRLRKEYGILTVLDGGRARLDDGSRAEVAVEFSRDPLTWSIFEIHERFDAREFAEYYGLGKTMTYQLLGKAVEEGKIEKFTSGRAVSYVLGARSGST